MNDNTKYGLFFLGGLAAGILGVAAVSKLKQEIKPVLTGLLSRGLDVREKVLEKIDAAR